MHTPTLLILAFFAHSVQASEPLWQRLKTEPDLVVLMRHAQAAGGDPVVWDETGNCAGESMLTIEGRALARKIGEAFSQRGIEVRVLSSPMCRCLQTARIAFGDAVATEPSLREIATADRKRTNEFEEKAQSLIASHRGASPLVLVSHRPNIDLLSFELIDEGVLLVARASANGEVTVLGKIIIQP